MILLSLLVHERPEVILDQIANIKKFAPDSLIVIHPARQFLETSNVGEVIGGIDGVWLNPKPFYTGFGMVLKCHISNFLHATKIGLSFHHICLHSSNDLFVRSGVERYVGDYEFGFQTRSPHVENPTEILPDWFRDFKSDQNYRDIMRAIGAAPTEFISQVEGMFFPREAFNEFATHYHQHAWQEFPFLPGYCHGTSQTLVRFLDKLTSTNRRRIYTGKYAYPREEFYLPNFFATFTNRPAAPYCLMNWDKGLRVTPEDINIIRSGGSPIPGYDKLFAVKRVNRKIDDPLRSIIRQLDII